MSRNDDNGARTWLGRLGWMGLGLALAVLLLLDPLGLHPLDERLRGKVPAHSSSAAEAEPMPPLWTMARWKSPRARAETSRLMVLVPPADSPKMVTLPGSPPKAATLSRTHSSARTMSRFA